MVVQISVGSGHAMQLYVLEQFCNQPGSKVAEML